MSISPLNNNPSQIQPGIIDDMVPIPTVSLISPKKSPVPPLSFGAKRNQDEVIMGMQLNQRGKQNIRAQSANVGTIASSLKWLTCNKCGQGGMND